MKSVRDSSPRALVIVGVLVTLILAALSVLALGALGSRVTGGQPVPLLGSACTAPDLPGTVVTITLTNMGGPMMGGQNGMVSGGAMRLSADHATVRHGTVSFLVKNVGSVSHEMVILPLSRSQIVGTRAIGGDARVDEAGSLGEASTTCGEGAGQGILPGTSSWISVALKPGRYELVCNLPGHYAAGMYAQLIIT